MKPDSVRSGENFSKVHCARAMNAPDESGKIKTKAQTHRIHW